MLQRLAFVLTILLISFTSFAQTYSIKGRIADFKDTSALIGVSVVLKDGNDTSQKTGLGDVTDVSGNFNITGVSPGKYLLHIEYLGYRSQNKMLTVTDRDFFVGTLAMKASTNELKGVTVAGKQIRAEQNGDTTSFHADAFKVNPDATAEDLINKMPGVSSDNTGVKVNGEAVQQVYVDGKPFFGTDPTLGVRNLPAEIVDKVEVFDQLSDQSLFTGFDDGNSQKTMNFVTKRDKREGEFGKIYGGYGTDGTFLGGESFNSFQGDRRISIIELSNNINQQNFSSQDLLGVSGSGGGGGGRGGGAFGGGGGGGGGGASNFLTGQQSGITTTHSAGINYSDQWGKKIKVTASYFFNYTDNVNNTQTTRNYTFPTDVAADSNQVGLYNEKDINQAKNFNNRFNVRFEYTIDSANSLIITPNLSLQENYATSTQVDTSFSLLNMMLSNAGTMSIANSAGYTFSNNILFRHKMHKTGRTISLNVGTSLNEKTGDGVNNTLSESVDSLNQYIPNQLYQRYTLYNNSNTISSNLTYTEPLSKKSQLMFNYNPSVTNSRSTKATDTLNNLVPSEYDFSPSLSNVYSSIYTTQRGGVSYRIGNKNLSFMIGANYQYAELDGSQVYPSDTMIKKTFSNVLPIAFFNYKFKNGKNLRIMYRTNISPPGITQLQNVVNISNPLQLSTGNENLKQDYEQTFLVRYGSTRGKSQHNFFLYAYGNYINNYIGNATYTSLRDSTIADGIILKRGAQLTAPVNLNYYSNNKIFVTYGIPADFIKSNLNLTGGLNYTHTPGLIDSVADYSNDLVPSAGIVISSNISQNLDFTLSYTGTYNFVKNSLQGQANNNYYNHTASFKINWIFLKGFVFNTNITHSYYSTLSSSSGNIDFLLWNAYVGYKFFKNRSLEARLSAFDILKQNKSITRTVGANYVENDLTNVLQQYFMFQLTYTLRHFKGMTMPTEESNERGNMPGGPPGGMPPGGGHWHDSGGM